MNEDLLSLIRRLYNDGAFYNLANDPFAQFGLAPQQYLGATILPERIVDQNMFREMEIRYRSIIAVDSTRFSPVQMRQGGELVGSMAVELGDSDMGSEMTGRDYDALLDYLGRGSTMEAEAAILGFADREVAQGLRALDELHRWQALVNAQVERVGDNGYREIVNYPNPTGQRVAAANVWSDNATDPLQDIAERHEHAADNGEEITRIVTSRQVATILTRNQNIKNQVQGMAAGESYNGVVGLPQVNALLASLGFATIEVYDGRYYTVEGAQRFLPQGTMVFLSATGRSETIESAEPDAGDPVFLNDTLGYAALGRAAGQQNSGRVILTEAFENKPPRVTFEGWQTSLPVLQSPQSVRVISQIS